MEKTTRITITLQDSWNWHAFIPCFFLKNINPISIPTFILNELQKYFSPDEKFQLDLNGLKLGFLFNSAKRYYDSFSQTDGLALAITYSRDFEFMGSDFDLNTLALEYKQYITFPKPSVLALRFGISDSWGKGKRFIYMGGANSKLDYHIAGGNMFDLMRGYIDHRMLI